MRRCTGFVLLALLPVIGCNQLSPTPPGPAPGPTPPANNGGTNNGGGGMTTNDPAKDWYAYAASDGNYSIKFPAKPDEKPESIDTTTGKVNYMQVSYETNAGKRAFLSTSMTYNIDPRNYDVEKGLDGARNGASSSTQATVSDEKKIEYKGAAGREFYMTMPNGTKAKEHIFIVNKGKGPVLYQALVVDTDGNINDSDTDLFLNSLDIKNP